MLLEEAQTKLRRFSENTGKSVGRLKTTNDVRLRQGLLQMYWKEYRAAFRAFKAIRPEDDVTSDDAFDAAEELFVLADGELDAMIAGPVPIGAGAMVNGDGQQNEGDGGGGGFRMKAIDVPKFSGEIDDWFFFFLISRIYSRQ